MRFAYKRFLVPVSRPVFSYGLKTPYGILGQEGFFDKFSVTFDRPRGEMILFPRRSV